MKLWSAGGPQVAARTIIARTCVLHMCLIAAWALTGQSSARAQFQQFGSQARQEPDTPQHFSRSSLSDETAADVRRVIQVFKQAAQDESSEVRAAAVSSLAFFAQYDESVLDLLLQAAQSPDADVREAAISTLLELESPSGATVEALLQLTGDKQTPALLRNRVLDRLEAWGSGVILAPAIAALESNSDTVRFSALNLLSRFKHRARPAIDALLALSAETSANPAVRSSALNTIEIIMRDVTREEFAVQQRELEYGEKTDEVLASLDLDHDGAISADECGPNGQVLISLDGRKMAISWSATDVNRDRMISRDELLTAIADGLGKRR